MSKDPFLASHELHLSFSKPMIRLSDLPQDILLAIYAYVTPQDLLSLNQTCHILHSIGTSDYAWHQLNIDIPLDINWKTRTGELRPFDEVRRSLVNALRIETNWNSKSTKIRNLMRIDHGRLVIRVQLLRDDWLLILSRDQRARNSSQLSAWYLDRNEGAHCIGRLEVAEDVRRLAAGARDEDNNALIVVLDSREVYGRADVYSLSLANDFGTENTHSSIFTHICKICSTDQSADQPRILFMEAQVNNNTTAIHVVRFDSPRSYDIVLIDLDTSAAVILRKKITTEEAPKFNFMLFPDYLVVLLTKDDNALFYCRRIEDIMESRLQDRIPGTKSARATSFSMDNLLIVDIELWLPVRVEGYLRGPPSVGFTFTRESTWRTQTTFASILECTDKLSVFHTTILPGTLSTTTSMSSKETKSFAMKPGIHVEILALGRTGYRMVWIERSWETDEYKLKKATLPMPGKRDDVVVHDFIPPHVALPFELHRCTTMWFEEARARICFGLHTGEVYILEL